MTAAANRFVGAEKQSTKGLTFVGTREVGHGERRKRRAADGATPSPEPAQRGEREMMLVHVPKA